MSDDWRWSDNPAGWENVKLHRPEKLPNTTYDRSSLTVTDLDTGDKLKLSPPMGPGDRPRQFGFYNLQKGPCGGSFLEILRSNSTVYVISAIITKASGTHRERAREEYDASRIAEMFRALCDHLIPSRSEELLVVDARPETLAELNAQRGWK